MAYDKTTDLIQIQADVLGTSLASNSKITGLNKLKTSAQVVLRSINEINNKLESALNKTDQATAAATEANESVAGVKNEVQTMVTEIVTQKMTEVVSGGIQNDEFVCEDNQTVFHLTKTPIDKENILFYINGVKYAKADYRYHEEDNTIEWLSVVQNEQHSHAFSIKSTDSVSAVYMS
jgi:hypothetical protein